MSAIFKCVTDRVLAKVVPHRGLREGPGLIYTSSFSTTDSLLTNTKSSATRQRLSIVKVQGCITKYSDPSNHDHIAKGMRVASQFGIGVKDCIRDTGATVQHRIFSRV